MEFVIELNRLVCLYILRIKVMYEVEYLLLYF